MKQKHLEAYMDTAIRFSKCSAAKRLKVGCIAVKDNKIISIGYNGTPSGWSNECEDKNGETKPEVLHAEANCIAKLAKSFMSGEDSIMFVTHAPCIHCAKMIYSAGVKKVFYKTLYRDNSGIEFLKKCSVSVIQIT